ncbi:RNA-binding cell elongation regulator Jag/EloR [Bavariicoccus seileri]|uniref:RNA-binding cell elongation regulator Jag/EloR n=1 Tax=Bavariicoccus seileri TaxID=549685 RepID=UPI0003B4C70F|nr:RNA-binding cell elongation regulator Jag/EloR [Bavariicoccus seileri]
MNSKDEVVVEGSTVDQAIQRGLLTMNLESKDVTIEVLDEGKKGLFGLGQRNAKVKLTRLTLDPIDEPQDIQYQEVQVLTDDVLDDESDSSDDSDDTTNTITSVNDDAVDGLKEETAASDATSLDQSDDQSKEDTDETSEFDQENQISEVAEDVAHYLSKVCEVYGAPNSVSVVIKPHHVIFQIESDKAGLIIGHHGKIIDALQNLAQVMLFRDVKGKLSVLVNVGDYRERRYEILKRIAERTAKKAIETRQPVFLEPLPSFERKIIHAELSRNNQVETHSEGKEPHRYLVVEAVD